MKRILLVAVFCFSKAIAQDIMVWSEKRPDIDFTNYTTYFWAQQASRDVDDVNYFFGDVMLKSDVRYAVSDELQMLGYLVDMLTPDLLINFRVYDKRATLSGYQGYGLRYWLGSEYTPEMGRSVEVEAGTIILSIVDRRKGVLVWEGYASGLMNERGFIKDETKIREAVNLIFQKYGLPANEYTKR